MCVIPVLERRQLDSWDLLGTTANELCVFEDFSQPLSYIFLSLKDVTVLPGCLFTFVLTCECVTS